MAKTAILRTRIEPERKAAAETVLRKLGITPSQAVNMFYAQIARRKAIPFPLAVDNYDDVLPPARMVAEAWDKLDDEDYSSLKRR